jgi:hypothetical protein
MRWLSTFKTGASLYHGWLVGGLIIGLLPSGGCSKPESPPVAYTGPTLASADFGLARPAEPAENGFVLLDDSPSSGRFPAALGVVRLDKPSPLFVTDDHLFVADRGWEIATLKQEESVYWNGLLKAIPQSRAVYVLDRRTTISPDCDLDEIIETARRIKLELCLIYGPRLAPDGSAGFGGVIYDVTDGKPLAYVQSDAGILDFEPPRPDRSKYDRSHQDVNYLAARRFEREVRNCFLALVARDTPPATTQPSPWRTSRDLRIPSDAVPVYIVPNRRTGS